MDNIFWKINIIRDKKLLIISKNLLRHFGLLHILISELLEPSSLHSLPPYFGTGCVHVRDLACVPLSQVFEQDVHSLHPLQAPCTNINVYNLIFVSQPYLLNRHMVYCCFCTWIKLSYLYRKIIGFFDTFGISLLFLDISGCLVTYVDSLVSRLE